MNTMLKSDQVHEATYVQCDRCQTWYELPPHVNLNDLPEKWYCENNTWDPVYAQCPAFTGKWPGTTVISENAKVVPLRVRSPSPMPAQVAAVSLEYKRPPTHVFKQPEASRSEIPPEKRHRADVSGEPKDIKYTLVSLIEALQATMELVADYQGEEDELFSRINEIIARLEAVSRSSLNPTEADKKALDAIIPNGLLIRLDREDGQNNPHLYTEETLRGILDCHNRADSAVAHFKDMVSRLKALSS